MTRIELISTDEDIKSFCYEQAGCGFFKSVKSVLSVCYFRISCIECKNRINKGRDRLIHNPVFQQFLFAVIQ